MTRDEFIDGYMKRSGIDPAYRTPDGFRLPSLPPSMDRIALPCACGYEECEGWAMVSKEGAEDHMRLYAPNPASP